MAVVEAVYTGGGERRQAGRGRMGAGSDTGKGGLALGGNTRGKMVSGCMSLCQGSML